MIGRITELIPRVYHSQSPRLIEFVELLEPEVQKIEALTQGLTEIIDIDATSAKYLPYVASLTGVPLIGDSPSSWRQQIKSWPEILKIKGTERSIEQMFRTLGIEKTEIRTYWRDGDGDLTPERPSGAPYQDGQGTWRNSKTHYFSVTLLPDPKDGHIPDLPLDELVAALKTVKPIYAELLQFGPGVVVKTQLYSQMVMYAGALVEVWPQPAEILDSEPITWRPAFAFSLEAQVEILPKIAAVVETNPTPTVTVAMSAVAQMVIYSEEDDS